MGCSRRRESAVTVAACPSVCYGLPVRDRVTAWTNLRALPPCCAVSFLPLLLRLCLVCLIGVSLLNRVPSPLPSPFILIPLPSLSPRAHGWPQN